MKNENQQRNYHGFVLCNNLKLIKVNINGIE